MDDNEDHMVLAAEYALGTLDADERAQVEARMAADEDFRAMVRAWEYRLGVLNQMVGSVEPRAEVWDRIQEAVVGLSEPRATVLPEPAPPPAPIHLDEAASPAVNNSNVVRLADRVRRWRGVASAMTALAAALVALLGIQIVQPDWLPQGLRPKPRTQIVEVRTPAPAPTPSAQYVAVLQGQNGGPAFILTVDGATRNFTVRKVGASPEPGKSYELWLIASQSAAPRSLGVIGADEFTERAIPGSFDLATLRGATYAVSLEPQGGSPSGAPTGPVLFTGKMVESVPTAPRT